MSKYLKRYQIDKEMILEVTNQSLIIVTMSLRRQESIT